MAYDEALADRIRHMLAKETVVEKKVFGGLAFMIGGNMSVAASGQGGLLVRVDPAQTEKLLGEPGAAEFEMGGRGPMRVGSGSALMSSTMTRHSGHGSSAASRMRAPC